MSIEYSMKLSSSYDRSPQDNLVIIGLATDGDIRRKLLDISLAKKKFNFYPKTDLEIGLKKTIKFYENSI